MKSEILELLRKEIAIANREYEHARQIFAMPYSGLEAMTRLYETQGYQRGISRAMDVVDRLTDPPAVPLQANPDWIDSEFRGWRNK